MLRTGSPPSLGEVLSGIQEASDLCNFSPIRGSKLRMSVSSQLVWALVKKNNVYLHKGLNGSQFSSEPGNLYNRHSYKYSGLSYWPDAPDSREHLLAWLLVATGANICTP